jgi:integrase
MPSSRVSRLPAYCLHSASGQAVVRIDGRDHYLGRHGSPESHARFERLLAEYLANGRRLPELTAGYTCQELAYDFFVWYRRETGEGGSRVVNVRLALAPLVAKFGDLPAAEFGPRSLALLREGIVAAGLTRGVVNERVGIVKRAFRWACADERIPGSTYHGLLAVEGLRRGRSAAREPERVLAVPRRDLDVVLPVLPPTVRAMVEVQLFTGSRVGEVLRMRAAELDRTGAVWLYRPTSHKNTWRGQERTIAIGPRAQAVLAPFLLRPGGEFLFSPSEAERRRRDARRAARRSKLWPSHVAAQARRRASNPCRAPRDHYDAATYARAIRRACDRVGVTPWNPGRLRHNAAEAVRREFGVEVTAAMLGHRDVRTTAIYAQLDTTRATEAASRIG